MDNSSGLAARHSIDISLPSASTSSHLAEMDSTATPLQFFEHADRLLLEATKITDFAEKLCEHVELMRKRASELRETASELHRIGVQGRERVTNAFQRILQEYEVSLPAYKLANPQDAEELELAVEEGRVLLEEADAFGDQLKAFIQPPADLADERSDDEYAESVPYQDTNFNNNPTTSMHHTHGPEDPLADGEASSHPQFEISGEMDDGITGLDAEAIIVPVSSEPTTRKTRRRSELDDKSSNVEGPVSKRTKRHTNREDRKTKLLLRMGYEESDVSNFLLQSVETPPRRNTRRRAKRQEKKEARKSREEVPHTESDS